MMASVNLPFHKPPLVESKADVDTERVLLEQPRSLHSHPLCADVEVRAVVPYIDDWDAQSGTDAYLDVAFLRYSPPIVTLWRSSKYSSLRAKDGRLFVCRYSGNAVLDHCCNW